MVLLHTHSYCRINACLLYWYVSRWHSPLLNLGREDEVLRSSGSSRKWETLTRGLLVMRRALQGDFLWRLLCLTRAPHPGWCPKLLEPQLGCLRWWWRWLRNFVKQELFPHQVAPRLGVLAAHQLWGTVAFWCWGEPWNILCSLSIATASEPR